MNFPGGVKHSGRFKHDFKRAQKRREDIAELGRVIEKLEAGEPLEPRHKQHKLSGEYADCRECHIAPNFLLVWKEEKGALILVACGSHSDLFD